MSQDEKPTKLAPDTSPFISIDFLIGSGMIHGLIQLNVGAQDMHIGPDGKIETVVFPSAHLRITPAAAKQLVGALTRHLEIISAAKTPAKPETLTKQ